MLNVELIVPYIPLQTQNAASAADTEGKNSDVKDQNSGKKSKGNSGVGNEKAVETGKATSGSGNEGASQRWISFFFFTISGT